MPTKLTICSIFPMRQVESREMFVPKSEYILEAPPLGSFSTLTIEAQTQGRYVGNQLDMPLTVSTQEIANDMLRVFRDGFGFQSSQGQPGIWITKNAKGIPTVEEIKKATEQQTLFADSVIEQATRLFRRKKYEDINQIHYEMAEWRGVEGLEWQEGTSQNQAQKCPFCKKSIPGDTIKCQYCSEIIDSAAYEEMKVKIGKLPPMAAAEVEELEVAAEERKSRGQKAV